MKHRNSDIYHNAQTTNFSDNILSTMEENGTINRLNKNRTAIQKHNAAAVANRMGRGKGSQCTHYLGQLDFGLTDQFRKTGTKSSS